MYLEKRDKLNNELKTLSKSNYKKISYLLIDILSEEKNDIKLDYRENFLELPGIVQKSEIENHQEFPDKKEAFEIIQNKHQNIDFKIYVVNNSRKATILWLVERTTNYEDGPEGFEKNIGVDFIYDCVKNKFFIVLSKEFKLRILSLSDFLKPTDEKILHLWSNIPKESKKTEFHNLLWESFDLQPINKEFYKNISEMFDSLVTFNKNLLNIQLFTTKLLGRFLFLKFLDEKNLLNKNKEYFVEDENDAFYKKIRDLFRILDDEDYHDKKDPDTVYLGGSIFEETNLELEINQRIKWPDTYFIDLIRFINKYNFTTDESTNLYQQVAIDPEMLGRILENLAAKINPTTNQQASKKDLMGVFYTPREMVDYMCRESLLQSFRNKNDDKEINDYLKIFIDSSSKKYDKQLKNTPIQDKIKNEINNFLDTVTIFDPACGSGAFPIGILQVLMRVYTRLNPEEDTYFKKLYFVENSIYGSDIDPIAIEITKLRTLLTIIVETDDEIEKIYLPNLEFKFIAANSLAKLENPNNYEQIQLGYDSKIGKEVTKIRSKYFKFNGTKEEKQKLRSDYDKLLKKTNEQSLFDEDDEQSNRNYKFASFNPFKNDMEAKFFNSEIMFGRNNFDIIIGNPPYLDYRKIDKDTKKEIEFYEVAKTSKMINLYVYFFELGLDNLSNDGVLTYITPQSYLVLENTEGLRSLIRSRSLMLLADFARAKVFDAATYPFVTLISNKKSNKSGTYIEFNQIQNLENYLRSDEIPNPIGEIVNTSESRKFLEKLSKLENIKKLSQITTSIVGSSSTNMAKKNISEVDESYGPLYLENSAIDQFSINHENIKSRVDKETYPEESKDIQEFPGIYSSKMTKFIRAVVFKDENILAGKVNVIHPNDEKDLYFLAGLLNSKLLNYWFFETNRAMHMQGEALPNNLPEMKKLPIMVTGANKEKIIELSKMLHNQGFNEELYEDLNREIYELYDLTNEEIGLVEKNTAIN